MATSNWILAGNTYPWLNLQKLKDLQIETWDIDKKVSQDIEVAQNNVRSKEQFKQNMQTVMKDNNLDSKAAFKATLADYKKRWFTIDGIDIDKELWNFTTPTTTTTTTSTTSNVEDKGSFIGKIATNAAEEAPDLTSSVESGFKNTLWWAISQLPEAVGNTFWFLADIAPWEVLDWLADTFRERGVNDKEALQDLLWVDPDSFATKTWEIWTEFWLMFVPWGQEKLIAKFPNAVNKVKELATAVTNLETKAPKIYNAIKTAVTKTDKIIKSDLGQSIIQWGTDAAKFGVVSEWEISPTWVVFSMAANPVITKWGKYIASKINWDSVKSFLKAINPTSVKWFKGNQTKIATEDAGIILSRIKESGEKPQSLEEWYNFMKTHLSGFYDKYITPWLTKSKSVSKVWDIVDDVYTKTMWTTKVGWVSKAKLWWQSEQLDKLDNIVAEWKKIGNQAPATQVEELKRYTAAITKANKTSKELSSIEEDFFTKLNKSLQEELDDKLSTVLWKGGATELKREYSAFSNRISDIDAQMLREAKKQGIWLFDGLGIISGVRDIAEWNIKSWVSSILTGKIIRLLKDPDELFQTAVNKIYKESSKWAIESWVEKWVAIGSEKLWEYLDNK